MNKLFFLILLLISLKAEAQTSALAIGDESYALGNYTKAIKAYKLHDKPEEIHEKIAKAYLALGNYDKALQFYSKAFEKDSTNISLQYNYGKILFKTKAYKHAKDMFIQLSDKNPKNPNFYYELGLAQEKISDTITAAQQSFKRAFELDKTHQKAIYKLAKHELQKRNFESVHQYVDKGLQSYQKNTQLISLKAQSYYWQEMYDDAVVWFEKLIGLGESSQFIHEKLSYCYVRLYDNKNALIHCEKALKYEPMNASNLFILAKIYQQEHDFTNAEKYYKLSIEVQNTPLDTEYRELAIVLNMQNKHDEAIKTLQKAIKENPENMQNRFFMLTTKSRYYGDLDEKIRLHEEFIKKYPNSKYTKHVEFLLSKLKNEDFMKRD